MASVKNYLSLIKFSHTIFAMPFALIGFFLGVKEVYYSADRSRYLLLFLLVIGCMITARSAAMAFNRYLDRQFDAKNPRTAVREIPAGIISEKNALYFTVLMSVLFITCTFFINRICFYLSPVALFIILFYSYTKRFTFLCHLVLGLGLSLAPIGAYLAVTGVFALLPVLFSVAVLCWVSGFDIIYALQDEAFDNENNLYSIPSVAGKPKALHISELLHALSAAAILFAGFYGEFGILYWVGAAVFCGMLIYQHSVVRPDDLRRVNLAFMTANGIASVVFAVFVLADLYFKY
ncbi:MAG: UbiA-like polyprenyltransferase [Ferruginibacter sp.]